MLRRSMLTHSIPLHSKLVYSIVHSMRSMHSILLHFMLKHSASHLIMHFIIDSIKLRHFINYSMVNQFFD